MRLTRLHSFDAESGTAPRGAGIPPKTLSSPLIGCQLHHLRHGKNPYSMFFRNLLLHASQDALKFSNQRELLEEEYGIHIAKLTTRKINAMYEVN